MANANGRIFIDTSTDPDKGVEIRDLQVVLQRGTSMEGLLCSDQEWYDTGGVDQQGHPIYALRPVNKITLYAKCKPMRVNKLGLLTTAEKQDAYYGLYIPIFGTTYTNNLATFLDEYEEGWTYLPPRGRAQNEWFRLRDFEGYNKYAQPFINENGCTFPTSFIYNLGAGSLTFTLGLNPSSQIDDYDSILITDLKLGGSTGTTTFAQMYFGLIFVDNADSTKRHIVTSSAAVGDSSSTSNITIAEGNDGLSGLNKDHTYVVYPVLSLTSTNNAVTQIQGTEVFVALPLTPFSFEQHTSATVTNISFMGLSAKLNGGKVTVGGYVTMQSTAQGLQSIALVNIRVYPAQYSGDDSGTTLLTSTSVTNLTPSTSKNFSKQFSTALSFDYVRVVAVADGHSEITATAYARITEGGRPPIEPAD